MAYCANRRQFLARGARAAITAAVCAPAVLRAAEEQWGDLRGRLVYDGKAPERKKLVVDKDLDCCGKFDIRDESLMVGPDGGLANVFVYLRTAKVAVSADLAAAAPKQVLLDNRNCIFQPHCMTIWFDRQDFHIVNSDPVAQNVAFSPLGNAPANIVLPVGGDATHRFGRKQSLPVAIACNYHPWESAYILPRDNPYSAVTAADGTFAIRRLPLGKLEFQVWHERPGALGTPQWPKGRLSLTIGPGANDLGTIKVDPSGLVKQ